MPTEPETEPPTDVVRGVLEAVASVVALAAIGYLALNWWSAHFTLFGSAAVITKEQVRTYWVGLAVLGSALLGTFVAAATRGARAAWPWHLVVAAVGVAAAVGFAVTTPGPVAPALPPTRAPAPHPASQCHSGGDNRGCPGG